MKQTSIELNIFPVYETVEVIRLVVPSGMIQVKTDKKSRVILKGYPQAIALVEEYYRNSTYYYSGGHTGFFNDMEFIFSEGHSFKIEEVGTNGKLVRIIIYKELFTGDFESKVFNETDLPLDLPFERDYILKKVDSTPICFANLK